MTSFAECSWRVESKIEVKDKTPKKDLSLALNDLLFTAQDQTK